MTLSFLSLKTDSIKDGAGTRVQRVKTKTWGYTIRVLLCAGALASGLTACSKREKVSAKSLIRNNTSTGPGKSFAISLPASNPFTSADTNLTLQGTCVTGASVEISGAETETSTCSTGVFSFVLGQTADGTYNYTLTHTLPEGAVTTTAPFQWIRDTSLPTTPTITTPPTNPVYTNTNGMLLSGTCVAGYSVQASGDLAASTTCNASGRFSMLVSALVDGSYEVQIKQKKSNGAFSAASTVIWVRDTVAPGNVTIDAPSGNPVVNSLSTLVLTGTCETDALVSLTGDLSSQAPCMAGAYSLTVSSSTDGDFLLRIKQTDIAGNHSSEVSRTWTRITTVPTAPLITSPNLNPVVTNQNSLVITGTCTTGNTVLFSGSSTGTANCNSGTFTAMAAATTDGTRTYSFYQKTPAGLISPASSVTWERDTLSPSPIVVSGPGTSPYTSSGDEVILTGSCESGATVSLTGALARSTTCSGGGFSFQISAASDGARTYQLKQTDIAQNVSNSISWIWIRDTATPEPPTLGSPLQNPYYSNQDSITISGTYTEGHTVRAEGDSGIEASSPCLQGAYSMSIARSQDGSYSFMLYQKSPVSIDSGSVSFEWIRDTIAPNVPTINSPASSPLTSNGSSIIIAGTCEDESTLTLDGDSQQQTICSGGNYSFAVQATSDGVKSYLVSQKDLAGNSSGQAHQIWIRDTVAPLPVTITQPGTNPYISGDTFLALTGSCENGATVALTTLPANTVSTLPCTPSETFSFPLSQTGDGIYSYSLNQRDLAGNVSTDLSFEWTIDTTIPSTPNLIEPAQSPIYTNVRSLTIKAGCNSFSPLAGEVGLTGDIQASEVTLPSDSLTATCSNNNAQFSITKPSDGTYSILVDQTNLNTGASSAPVSVLWIVDTVAPLAPALVSPSSNPYVAPGDLHLQGTCETGATLFLEGAYQHSEICQGGFFSWTISHLSDGEYDFRIYQTDLAQNRSLNTDLHWSRDANSVAPPVILSPSSNPHISNQQTLTLNGICTAGNIVTLTGQQSGSTTCTQNGSFSFVLAPTADGTLNYELIETMNQVDSAPTSFEWVRDTVSPILTLSAQPSLIHYSTSAGFVFSSNEPGTTYECKLDSATFGPCISPVSISPANGLHSFSIRGTDLAGNVSLATTVSWEQKAFNTVAYYRFNSTSSLANDSGPYLNHATASGSVTSATGGQFTTSGASFTTASTGSLSTAQNDTLNLGSSGLTIEGFFRLSMTRSSSIYYTLVSKSASSTSLSYEVRVRRPDSSKYCIDVLTMLSGNSTIKTTTACRITYNSSTWNYFAVTYSQGVVSIYTGTTNGSATKRWTVTNGNVGTSSSTLAVTNSPLRIGTGPTGSTSPTRLSGMLDEIRISQTVRNVSVVPSAAFNPTQ